MSSIVVESSKDSDEKRKFGSLDSAVEYINHRPRENFKVYATDELIKKIREKVNNIITKG